MKQKVQGRVEGERRKSNATSVFGIETKLGTIIRRVLMRGSKVPEVHVKGETVGTFKTPDEECTHMMGALVSRSTNLPSWDDHWL